MTLRDAALRLAEQNVAIFPCNVDKTPLTPHGFKDATTDLNTVRMWWTRWPYARIGAPTGSRNGFSVIDLDVKHGHNGFASVPDWETRSNVVQRTESGGAHLFFAAEGAPGNTASVIADGVDTRGEGGYVILYDTNLSFDFLPPWPDDLRPSAPKSNGHHVPPIEHEAGWIGTTYGLAVLEREAGKVLAAPKGTRNDTYNKAVFNCSQLVDLGELDRQHMVTTLTRAGLATGMTAREVAATGQSGMRGAALNPRNVVEEDPRYEQTPEQQEEGGVQADAIMPSRLKRKKGPLAAIPQHLLNVPGMLNEVVAYYTATAPKNQPQFAVQTALAVGSVLMGRRYATDQKNFSSLYFLNVSQSATGKEHAKTVIEELLEAADLTHLIGPPGYTSASGVFSSLLQQPTHISVIDEIGRVLQSTKTTGNAHKIDVVTIFMEAFGRLHSTLRQQGYSKVGLTEKQAETFDRAIIHPALTILAMTTPDSLYESLSGSDIVNGFLARFIIVESFLPREASNQISFVPVPNRLVDWMRITAKADDNSGGMPLADELNYEIAPAPLIVPFDYECLPILRDFDQKLMKDMDTLDRSRMETMLGRTKEIAQRLALIVAVSCGDKTISPLHLQWAIDYADFYAKRAITSLRSSVADSSFEAACKAVYSVIKKAGIRGVTGDELARATRHFARLKPAERRDVMQILQNDYDVMLREMPTGGRARKAWVASIDSVND